MPNATLLTAVTGTNSPPVDFCTTSVVTVAKTDLFEAETFTIWGIDSTGTPYKYVFEFDGVAGAANGVTSGRTAVDVSSASTADQIAAACVAAINGTAIEVTAAGSASPFTLTADVGGSRCNFSFADTVANGTFAGTLTNATAGTSIDHMREGESAVLCLWSSAGTGTMTVTCKLWGWSGSSGRWFPLGTNATAANKGLLNEGNAIGETASDKINHAELVNGILHFEKVYLEITAIGGTSTAINATLEQRSARRN